MAANVLDYIADALTDLIAADTTLNPVRVYNNENKLVKPQVYAYCAGISYGDTYESRGSTGLGIATCGIIATQFVPADTSHAGTVAVATGELISKIQYRLWNVDCDTIATHTDSRFTCRIQGITYEANDGCFDNAESMIRIGFNVSVTINLVKL